MKLLIITQKYDINDSNLGVFIDWWNKLAERLEKVYILALEKKSDPTKLNIEAISMGKEKGNGFFWKFFDFYYGLLKNIGKTDAILVHMIPKYVILAVPFAFIFRKPIYLWYTGVSANCDLKIAVKFCRKVFTAHEAAMRIDTQKRIITGHGIDTNIFKISHVANNMSHVTILSVGRITPSKGHDLIIKAVSDLVKFGYNLKLKIIGGVIQNYHLSYFAGLRKLVNDLKLENHVEFLGEVIYRDMPRYFNGAKILINAVPFGGLDKVVLEAMSSGVVPLTSNSAFLNVLPAEVNQDLVFKTGDPEDLKNKLKNILDKKLYQNNNIRQELRNVLVKNHNLDNLIERIFREIKND